MNRGRDGVKRSADSPGVFREGGFSELRDFVRRAFGEFLALPTAIIAAFLLLAALTFLVDRGDFPALAPLSAFLRAHVFANAKATSDLLSTIAGSIITVASITISLLLVALQQSAGSMTAEVFDQFLRRRINQFYFGFFVGLALYALLTLATVNEPFNPVFGGTVAFLLTVVALYLLILLLYTTINQMRPVEIVETIHDHILAARERQKDLLSQTRRTPQGGGAARSRVAAERHGFVTRLDIGSMDAAARKLRQPIEIVLQVSTGSFVAFGDPLAEISAENREEAETLGDAVRGAIHLEPQRDVTHDPAYGIAQVETIAWTSISSSKSNPAPGILTIRSLRDILSRWAAEEKDAREKPPGAPGPLPIVYADNVLPRLMDAFETLAVCSSESMQHQNFVEVVRAFADTFERLPEEWRRRTEDVILRILSAMGDHVLTAQLNRSLTDLAAALQSCACAETASAVIAARDKLALSVGKLHSRSTRTG